MKVLGFLERARDRFNARSTCEHVMSMERHDGLGADYLVCEKCGHEELTVDS